MSTTQKPLTIGILGAGTVGTGVLTLVEDHSDQISRRVGAPVQVGPVLVRDIERERARGAHYTTDIDEIIANENVDIVVEVMGGVEPARTWLIQALNAGQSVVTANKELLSKHGKELHDAAAKNGVRLEYEAAVAGAIPIIRPMRDSLSGDNIESVLGILNGTTNFILTKMAEEGATFADVLKQAQELGFAEADPSADVEGYDAAAKTAILASIAFDTVVTRDDVIVTGITGITAEQMSLASKLGYSIKLLGSAQRVATDDDKTKIAVGVSPAWVHNSNPLANVRGANNAVLIQASGAGRLMFYGPGAGSLPTGSAVVGDVVTAARGRLAGERASQSRNQKGVEIQSGFGINEYGLLFEVKDQSGVLSDIASVMGKHGMSLRSVWQEPGTKNISGKEQKTAYLLMITHEISGDTVDETLVELEALESVKKIITIVPVIE